MEDEKFTKSSYNELLLEQYKIATEMADRISARREGANKIFLSANSIILIFVATKSDLSFVHIFICIFGIFLSVVWASILKNYRSLNSAKYAVILEMEEKLAWKVYGDEWKKLKEGKDKKVYAKLTVVEKKLPYIFAGFYILLFAWIIFQLTDWSLINFIYPFINGASGS